MGVRSHSYDNKKVSIKYNHGAKKVLDFRLLKVKDASRNACKKFIKTDEYKLGSATGVSELDLDISPAEDPVDLIAKSDNTLALYYLYVSDPTVNNSSSNIFYSGTFVLATLEGGVNIMQAGNYCKPPGDYNSNFDYCAINKFVIIRIRFNKSPFVSWVKTFHIRSTKYGFDNNVCDSL